MRIISGRLRGRSIASPPSNSSVRPTSDRIKETLFNILASSQAVAGKRVLDLFAGCGSLGIEAHSQGAGEVVFVDTDRTSAGLIKSNLRSLGLKCEVFNVDFRFALRKLESLGRQFDLILIDPPYNFGLVGEALRLIAKHNTLADGGMLAIEHSVEENPPEFATWQADSRSFGKIKLSVLTKKPKENV